MSRGPLNLLVDFAAALSLLAMVATGYILRFPLPPSTNRTHELWGMSRHEWGTLHSWTSMVLLAVLFVHLVLHWDWIFTKVRQRFARAGPVLHGRRVSGLLTLAALALLGGGFAWMAHSGVRELEKPRHPLRDPVAADPAPVTQTVDFQRDVAPIFAASCLGCHGPKKQRSGFRVDRREDFFASGSTLIVPGKAGESRLIAIVSGEVEELKSDHLLTPREIAVLKTWINTGAKWRE